MIAWFFDHRVGSRLFKYGWHPSQLREHAPFSNIFSAIRASGYDVDRAADLWSKVLSGDSGSRQQKCERTLGVFGIMYLEGSRLD